MASTTKAGWSNRIYSELLSVNNCLAFDENSSHLACWRATSASYFCCSGSGGRDGSSEWTPCLPVESTRMGREPSERLCCSRCHPPAFAPSIGRVLRYRQQELRSPRSVGLQPLHRPAPQAGVRFGLRRYPRATAAEAHEAGVASAHQAAHQVSMRGTGVVHAPAAHSFAADTRATITLGMRHHMVEHL